MICKSCREAPTGSELQEALSGIRRGLMNAVGWVRPFNDIESSFRQERHSELETPNAYLNIKSGPGIASLIICSLGVAPVLRMLAICIISFGYGFLSVVLYLIAPVVYGSGVVANNRGLRKAGTVLSVFFFLEMVLEVNSARISYHQAEDMAYVHAQFAIAIGALVASFPVILLLVKLYNMNIRKKNEPILARNEEVLEADRKWNEEVRRYNDCMAENGKEIAEKLQASMNSMRKKYPWFPRKYYVLSDVENFLASIQNGKANTMEELVEESMKEFGQSHTWDYYMMIAASMRDVEGQPRYANMVYLAQEFVDRTKKFGKK